MAVDDGILVGPTGKELNNTGALRRWLAAHPWARINEPPAGVVANAVVYPWYKADQVIAGAPPSHRVLCWAVHAAEPLERGQEIFMHYSPLASDDYALVRKLRGYCVGSPAKPLKKAEVPLDESPAATFGHYTLQTAIF